MKLNRREMLALALGLAAAPAFARDGEGAESLKALAARSGRRFGSAIGIRTGSFGDPRYVEIIARDCGLIVPENELKWQWTRPAPDRFDFRQADRIMDFAEAHHLAVRGHTLLWHHPAWFPEWVASYDFGANPVAEAERMLREHIATICRRYGTRIHGYDVVNEAVDPATGGLRDTAFSRAMGGAEAVLDLAFHAAREAAPHAQLVYNDYMSWTPNSATHRDGVLRLLEGFRRRNVSVDALGVQAHIGAGNNPGDPPDFGLRDEAAWRRFLDEVVAMGYDLLVTEFDVHDRGVPADFALRDRAVADLGGAFLELMLSYPQLGDILAWGMADSYSWLQGRTPRADGLPKRPCPYDADFRPKPLRAAMAAALAGAGSRHQPRTA
jgi:endo-1,4-beta-xylanase